MPKVLRPLAIYSLLKELRIAAQDYRPLVVDGARALVPTLRRELARDGDPSFVREGGAIAGAAALVYVLGSTVGPEDERALREANRARVPVVCMAPESAAIASIPYVLATDVLTVPPGAGFPVDRIAEAIAHRLGEQATPLAAHLPVLRPAVCAELIERFSFRAAVIGATVFLPGTDFPVLALNQMRLVLRIGSAHGVGTEPARGLELAAVLAGGLGLRAIQRELGSRVPLPGWAVKAAVSWAGTRVFGEAAVRYYPTVR